jgi:pimeloyl-ACP methyl ester carboxylesterase
MRKSYFHVTDPTPMKNLYTSFLILLSASTQAQINQPPQPTSGPGGSEYTHGGVTHYDYGTNGSGGDFWLYEPNDPTPDSANVVVFIHGLGETNPKLYGAFIKHLVRKGNIVIYPRYQTDLNSSNATFNDSCARGILRALDTTQQPNHVKGRSQNFFILGHSVGGILTANMTMLHAQYGLPKPLSAFSMQPGAASFLSPDYSAFPADVPYLIMVSENDLVVGTDPGYTLYQQTVNVPTSHKNVVHTYGDNHGSPGVTATHFDPLAGDLDFDNGETNFFIIASGNGPVDAFDHYCSWKLQDALMDCALRNENCEYAFGDTPEQHGMGNWSDGTPVRILEITPSSASSVNDVIEDMNVKIYPNPIENGLLQLYIDVRANGSYFELTDVNGRTVLRQLVPAGQSTLELRQPISGFYFYQIRIGSGESLKTGKLIVN